MEEKKDPNDRQEQFVLAAKSELRFEVDHQSHIELILSKGTGEIFGTELALLKTYTFPSYSKAAVYTWHGCTLSLKGKTEAAYVATDTPMQVYLNSHHALEQMRDASTVSKTYGPRIMVVGPKDSGKSTMVKLLLNWAVRAGRTPILVDLDVGQSELSIPGTMGAIVVERPADVLNGFHQTAPLLYHFGHVSPSGNIPLYSLLNSRIAEMVNLRCRESEKVNSSGIVVNTCGWVRDGGYQALIHVAGAYEIDYIIVLGLEILQFTLKRDVPPLVKIVLMPKSGGVVERTAKSRQDYRDNRIKEYFYGTKGLSYFPHTFDVHFSEVNLFKIGGPNLPESMLPMGTSISANRTKIVRVTPSEALRYHVISISQCNDEKEDIVRTNVAGFIIITNVDMENKIFTILSPTPHPLPRSILLLMESISFMEID